MLSMSREKIYEGLGLRPIVHTYGFDKGLGLRHYAMKSLIVSQTNFHHAKTT